RAKPVRLMSARRIAWAKPLQSQSLPPARAGRRRTKARVRSQALGSHLRLEVEAANRWQTPPIEVAARSLPRNKRWILRPSSSRPGINPETLAAGSRPPRPMALGGKLHLRGGLRYGLDPRPVGCQRTRSSAG